MQQSTKSKQMLQKKQQAQAGVKNDDEVTGDDNEPHHRACMSDELMKELLKTCA